jgi:hypothetical protein
MFQLRDRLSGSNPQAQAHVSRSTHTRPQTHRHCRGPCGQIQAQNVPPESAVRKPPRRRRLFSISKIASTVQGRRGLLGGLVGWWATASQSPGPGPSPASEIPASRVLYSLGTLPYSILTIAGVLASRKCQQFSNAAVNSQQCAAQPPGPRAVFQQRCTAENLDYWIPEIRIEIIVGSSRLHGDAL